MRLAGSHSEQFVSHAQNLPSGCPIVSQKAASNSKRTQIWIVGAGVGMIRIGIQKSVHRDKSCYALGANILRHIIIARPCGFASKPAASIASNLIYIIITNIRMAVFSDACVRVFPLNAHTPFVKGHLTPVKTNGKKMH